MPHLQLTLISFRGLTSIPKRHSHRHWHWDLGRSNIRWTNPKPDTDAQLKNTDWETSPDPIRYLIPPCSIYPLSDERAMRIDGGSDISRRDVIGVIDCGRIWDPLSQPNGSRVFKGLFLTRLHQIHLIPEPQTPPDNIEGQSKFVCECPYANIRVSPICVIHDFAYFILGHRYIEVPLNFGCMGMTRKGCWKLTNSTLENTR